MAEKVAKESNIKRLTENIALTYQPLEEGKGLIESTKVDKLDTIDAGAQVNVIEKITLNGEPVTVEAKTAKISIDALVDGKLDDYIDSAELESALQEYAKKTDLDLYAKKEELTALEGRVDGINTRLSSAEEQTAKVPEIEAGLAKKADQEQVNKDKAELQTAIDDKANQSDLETLEDSVTGLESSLGEVQTSLEGFVTKDELGDLSGVQKVPVYEEDEIVAMWLGTDTVQVDYDNLSLKIQDTSTINVTSSVETITVTVPQDVQTYFSAEAAGLAITVTGLSVGEGYFSISADGLRDAYIYVSVVEE